MVLDYHYTFAKQYPSRELSKEKTFILRLIQRELQKLVDFELTDDIFLEIYDAVFLCRIDGPIAYLRLYFGRPINDVLYKNGIVAERHSIAPISQKIIDYFFPPESNQVRTVSGSLEDLQDYLK